MLSLPNSLMHRLTNQSGKNGLVSRLARWSGLAMLGVGFAITGEAQAAERVTFVYQGEDYTVTIDQLSEFAKDGTVPPTIQKLFDTGVQAPTKFTGILDDEITISPRTVQKVLDSSVGEFLLLKLDNSVNIGDIRDDERIAGIRIALEKSYNDDNAVSVLEILKNYPQEDIRVDVSGLEKTYNDVERFVEQILPALEVAKEFIADIVCDCDNPTSTTTAAEAEPKTETDAEASTEPETSETAPKATDVKAHEKCNEANNHTVLSTPQP
ncbi:MAG: alpha/beta hydrolase [Cyanobacteria bacterium P01_H01_bin.15]